MEGYGIRASSTDAGITVYDAKPYDAVLATGMSGELVRALNGLPHVVVGSNGAASLALSLFRMLGSRDSMLHVRMLAPTSRPGEIRPRSEGAVALLHSSASPRDVLTCGVTLDREARELRVDLFEVEQSSRDGDPLHAEFVLRDVGQLASAKAAPLWTWLFDCANVRRGRRSRDEHQHDSDEAGAPFVREGISAGSKHCSAWSTS